MYVHEYTPTLAMYVNTHVIPITGWLLQLDMDMYMNTPQYLYGSYVHGYTCNLDNWMATIVRYVHEYACHPNTWMVTIASYVHKYTLDG